MFKTKTKTSLKRMLSVTLALAMSASMTTVFPVTAEENTLRIYSGDGYEVSYSVKGSWDGNQNIEVSLTNTGSESLLNWALKYDAHGEIGGLWNGSVYDSDSTKYIVKNAGYNYEIQPEQTVTFGYTLSGEELDFPETIELCSQRTERSGGYNVTMDITDDWDTGFSGTVTVENTGEEPLEAWRLSFDTNFTIDNIWNAQIVSSEGNRYTVVNDVTTTPIGIGERKAFGFTASKQSGVVPAISDFAMSEIMINGDFTTMDIPGDEEEDIFVYAFGEYNEDENAIDIEWYSNADDGCEYEVSESVDNIEYTSVIEVSDFTTYRYHIDEDFDTKYFKVKVTSSDKTAESVPFAVNRTDDGYSVDFLDSDGDGLADIYEDIIGTDINSLDTDGDGLTDYQEVYITGTDPTKYDSVTEGVSDSDADNDSDGLSNGTELELGTDPMAPDSDSDGLNDGEEMNVYGTDPLNPDTDGDTLPDGDEPHIGLDPTNPQTFGTPDEEYVTEQTISADSKALAEINTAENPYELTIKYTGTGYAEGNLSAGESGYANAIQSDAVLGKCVDISYESTCKIDECVLYYKIKDNYVENVSGEYAAYTNELDGIKRLQVFRFYEDMNVLLPVETEYDVEKDTVICEISELGTYCVVDVELWIENIGFDAEANSYEADMKMVEYGSHEYGIYTGKRAMSWIEAEDICERLNGHLATITSYQEQQTIEHLLPFGTSDSYWLGATDIDKEGTWKWVTGETFDYTNWGNGQPDAGFGNTEDYLGITKEEHSWALFGEWNDYTVSDGIVESFIFENDEYSPRTQYTLIGNNFKRLTLINELENGGTTDTDSDGLTDWEEFDSDNPLLAWDDNGNPVFPSFTTVSQMVTGFCISDKYRTEINGLGKFFDDLRVAPFDSDPTVEDTDGDGIDDDEDYEPLKKNAQIDSIGAQELFDLLDEELNKFMPPQYNENGDKITSKNKECTATWNYFQEYIWVNLPEYQYSPQNGYAAYVAWLREAYGVSGIEKFWVDSSMYIGVFYNELMNITDTLPKAISQVVKGNYSDDITITGTAGQIVISFSGIDFVADIRDVTYDLTHWKWSWSHAGQTGLDMVGILPVVGVLKNADEFSDLRKLFKDSSIIDDSIESIDSMAKSGKMTDEIIAIKRAELLKRIEDCEKSITDIAKKYENFQCVECTDAISIFLEKQGLTYDIKSLDISKLDKVSPKYTKIWSDDMGTFISENGFHTGVQFNNKIYDNIHVDGVSLETWLSDMVISYDTGSVDLWQLYKAGILQFN